MKFKFNYKNKERELNVKICDNVFSKARGLMFGNDKNLLLFIFNMKGRRAIHSFFCKPFYAIWFDGKRIVDERLVERWMVNVKPIESFDKLLEIPPGCKEFLLFTDGRNI